MAVLTACAHPVARVHGLVRQRVRQVRDDQQRRAHPLHAHGDLRRLREDEHRPPTGRSSWVLLCINDPAVPAQGPRVMVTCGARAAATARAPARCSLPLGSVKFHIDITNEAASCLRDARDHLAAGRLPGAWCSATSCAVFHWARPRLPRRGDVQHVRVQAVPRARQHR